MPVQQALQLLKISDFRVFFFKQLEYFIGDKQYGINTGVTFVHVTFPDRLHHFFRNIQPGHFLLNQVKIEQLRFQKKVLQVEAEQGFLQVRIVAFVVMQVLVSMYLVIKEELPLEKVLVVVRRVSLGVDQFLSQFVVTVIQSLVPVIGRQVERALKFPFRLAVTINADKFLCQGVQDRHDLVQLAGHFRFAGEHRLVGGYPPELPGIKIRSCIADEAQQQGGLAAEMSAVEIRRGGKRFQFVQHIRCKMLEQVDQLCIDHKLSSFVPWKNQKKLLQIFRAEDCFFVPENVSNAQIWVYLCKKKFFTCCFAAVCSWAYRCTPPITRVAFLRLRRSIFPPATFPPRPICNTASLIHTVLILPGMQ